MVQVSFILKKTDTGSGKRLTQHQESQTYGANFETLFLHLAAFLTPPPGILTLQKMTFDKTSDFFRSLGDIGVDNKTF